MLKNHFARNLAIILLSLGTIVMVFPLVWMVATTFKSPLEAMAMPPTIWAKEFSFDAYIRVFTRMDFLLYLKNTLILVLFQFGGLFISALCGYGFAKYEFKHKNLLFILILATMMIPSQVSMIPNFIIITSFGLANTFLGMALPGLVGGFTIFLFRQFMENLPDEIIEAARIEGMGEFQIFLKVIIPMSKPVIAIQVILAFIGSWNAFLWPLIVAQSADKYPLSVAFALTQGQNTNDVPMQMAGATLMVLPIIVLFIMMQKYILDGYNTSGIK
ncbi:MAG: carbohydrate ABC transporter permease [Mycoplasmatales bacterium]